MKNKIPKVIEIELRRMKKLEIREQKLSLDAKAILSTSAMGQAPPCYHNTVGKMLVVNQKRAEIWNGMRSKIAAKGKSLWQLALENKLIVKTYGRECILNFNSEDIKRLLIKGAENGIQ